MTNLLFVTIDDFMSLSAWPLYQDIAITPNMDAFLSENANFNSAFSDVALCNPSRASILTGQRPWDTGIINNSQTLEQHVDLATETLPGILKGAGYHTAIGGKVFHTLYEDQQPEVASEILSSNGLRNTSGPEYPEVRGVTWGTTTATLSDDTLADNVKKFLHDYDGDAPFALFAGIYRPHADWIIPQEYIDLYLDVDIPIPDFVDSTDRANFLSVLGNLFHEDVLAQDAWQDMIRHYLASMSYADAKLGEMLTGLARSGHADDTVTVVMSDHGYHLGDAEKWHKFTTYEQAARAPLGISAPGEEARIIDAPVNLSSVSATILDLLGLPPVGAMQPSLVDYVTGTASAGQTYAITWTNASLSVRSESYRYTLFENGEEELFDIAADIMNVDNLADSMPDVVAELRAIAQAEIGDDLMIYPSEGAIGSAGDTNFYFNTTPVEVTDEGGIDTVFVGTHYTLPDDMENLQGVDGNGNLTLTGNLKNNRITGSLDRDHLYGLAGNDYLFGGGGEDHLYGGLGEDVLAGGPAADFLDGGDNNDIVYGQFGDDTLLGDFGDDELYGGEGRDDLSGGVGQDKLFGGYGNDILDGGSGNDILDGGAGYDTIRGGAGIDTAVVAGLSRDYFAQLGSLVNFTLVGGGQRDRMVAIEFLEFEDITMSAEDFIAFSQTYEVTGSAEADVLFGAGLGDTLYGGSGDDILRAHAGADELFGGDGNDTLDGGAGSDILRGGNGIDTATYISSLAPVSAYLTAGFARIGADTDTFISIDNLRGSAFSDRLSGNSGANWLQGAEGDDIIRGRGGDDLLSGDAGIDKINGGAGADILYGGLGRDYILGGDGADILHGGQGNDVLTGGAGVGTFDGAADVFVFGPLSEGYGGFDRIKDWEDGIDRIDLTRFGFTDFDTEVAPLATARASGADLRIKFGPGEVLYINNFNIADFDATDVIL